MKENKTDYYPGGPDKELELFNATMKKLWDQADPPKYMYYEGKWYERDENGNIGEKLSDIDQKKINDAIDLS